MSAEKSGFSLPVVVNQTYDLARWTLERVEQFPRSRKFTLGDRLEAAILDVLEFLLDAAYSSEKRSQLSAASKSLQRFRILVRLSADLKCLSLRQQEYAVKQAEEVGRQIGGWMKTRKEAGAAGLFQGPSAAGVSNTRAR